MYEPDLEKAEEPEINLPAYTGSQKKQGDFRKTSTSASLTTLKPLTVWITRNYGKFLKRWECQTCLQQNLYAGQEAPVRTGHGTMDWFQIGKGVCQGCILSPCLFNLYAEHTRTSLIAQLVKNMPAMQETLVRFLSQKDPLEKR